MVRVRIRSRLGGRKRNVADQIDELAESRLVESGPCVLLGQYAFERWVVPLDAGHCVVHDLADRRLAGLRFQVRPARFGRHPEDVLGAIFVGVFRVRAARLLGDELRVLLLERIRDVLEEDETQRTTCLYSAASMLPRSASAICQSCAS